MTGAPVRVAVQEGTGFVRLACAPAEGPPRLVAELPAPGPGVPALLTEFVGPPPEELVLVHPARWPPERAARWARECAGSAARIRTLAAPLAAAGPGAAAVLDVGASMAEATLLGPDSAVRAVAAAEVGGRVLDELVAARTGRDPVAARALREALSLLPSVDGVAAADLAPLLAAPLRAAVAPLREVAEGAGRVLLVGGLARSPALARAVDEAGIPGAQVAPRPEAAAVLGALAHVAEPVRPAPAGPPPTGVGWLPALPVRRRTLRAALLGSAAAIGAVALLGLGRLPAPPAVPEVPAGVLVQYGYRLDVPAGWEHTGGLPERRRVLLTPRSAPEGSDLIAVERTSLGYDTAAEPQRARTELRAVFDAAVAAGSRLSAFDPDARVGGREATAYRQEEPGGTVVDWYVVLDGDAQLSVGCRHTPAGAEAVRAACAAVAASVTAG
ncbi:type VII secretion-associated protein [Pseudonocardia zijingensis]|uniref:type VII secretion-associated protein n=3 Tax=Pseudonocardia zijingensis TaxID=153376 RepID=UPI00360D0875